MQTSLPAAWMPVPLTLTLMPFLVSFITSGVKDKGGSVQASLIGIDLLALTYWMSEWIPVVGR